MAIDVAQLRAKVGLDASDLERDVMRARGVLGGLAETFGNMAGRAISTAAGFLIRDVVIGSWRRLNDVVRDNAREMVDQNRQWEGFETRLATQLKSYTLAAERLRELEEFAVVTPFGLDEVIQADITLQNFGLHSEAAAKAFGKSGSDIRTIAGNTAAGVGASFNEISMWLGRFAAGDTGQAIMRMQELGVTTRAELASLGVEFNKSGQLVSPLDEAMTALLTVMERKFGGLMDVQSRTLGGMESNLGDWLDRQRRLWGEPVFDEYKEGLGDLLGFLDSEGVNRALDIGREMWASLVGWIGDVARDWAAGLGGLAADALYWGANIVEQFAAGIQGSDAVAGALRSMADEVAGWLRPGSPPRIMPWLTEYGAGAAAAYWEGWAEAEPDIGMWLRDAYASLEPHLRAIQEAGGLDAAGLEAFRGAFGAEAPRFEGYFQAYGGLVAAAQVAAEAQVAYDAAVAEGDEEAIAAAEEQLETARDQERAAQRRVAAEQSRIAQSMSAEARLARATEERYRQEESAAQRAAQREAEAEARRAEAEAKRVADARLRWELAVAETPEKQLEIWQRELAATEEGTAEYFDTLTRIVQLEQRIRDERERGAGGGGAGWAAGIGDEAAAAVSEAYTSAGEALAGLQEDLERTTLGEAIQNVLDAFRKKGEEIGQAILDGIASGIENLATKFQEWADKPETRDGVYAAGSTLGGVLVDGIRALLGMEPKVDATAGAMETHLRTAAFKAGSAAWEIGMAFGDAMMFGMVARFTEPAFGVDAEELAAAWFGPGIGHVPTAAAARLFDSDKMAAEMVRQFLDAANNPELPPAVREAAAEQANTWLEEYDLKMHAELGPITAAEFAGLVMDVDLAAAIGTAGATAGTTYADEFSRRATERLRAYPPQFDWNYEVPAPDLGPIPGYASGGVAWSPTLAWLAEREPEVVIPFSQLAPPASSTLPASRGGDTYDITIRIDARGANAREVKGGVVAGLRAAGVTA